MDDTSTCIPISRHHMGSTHMRQVRILPHHTGYKVQLNPCRSIHQWCRCIGSDGLEQRKQFHKCSFETIRQNNVKNRVPESSSNGQSTGVDGNAVVQQTTTPFNLRPYQIAKGKIVLPSSGLTNTRTSSKQKVEMVRLESFWLNKFSARHWNENCFKVYHHFLAESTLEQYNSYLTKYKDFCVNSYGEFPPQVALREASVTGFLFSICQKSKRPRSIVKMAWAAITHLYDSLELNVRSGDMSHFMQALVKRFTSCPQGRTPIPPIQPILNVFRKWGCNEKLPIEKLRQKCIALLCLTAMCRPSDIAPNIGFLRKQIQFNSDKSAVKNDTNRKGFEIRLTAATEKLVDPVESLRCYLQPTNDLNKECGNGPVFRSLTSQSERIGPSTVA